MITRTLEAVLKDRASRAPVVTVTGPRQSGKTTLCRSAFPEKPYASLEAPAEREFALSDPQGFLARHPDGMIIDEVQRAPDLLSYIQVEVDEDATPSRYVLSGSQNLALHQAVSQSLAGRTALLQLLPLSFDEIKRFERPPGDRATTIWTGGYPRIYDRQLPAAEWLADYTNTYVERDVRQILNVGDLVSFQTFLRLCAGRAGQLLSLSGLGADAGISHVTAKRWLSVLEAGFVVFRLLPHHRNLGKRLVKSPKALLLRYGPGVQPAGHRRAQTARNSPVAWSNLRELGDRGDREAHSAPRPDASDPLSSRPTRTRSRSTDRNGPSPRRRGNQVGQHAGFRFLRWAHALP